MQMCPKCSQDNRDNDLFCGTCGAHQIGLLGRGTVLQGRYRLDGVLESGSTQTSYRAIDLRLAGQPVVVKENRDLAPAEQQQFGAIANELAAEDQPATLKVIDYFVEPSGRQYMVAMLAPPASPLPPPPRPPPVPAPALPATPPPIGVPSARPVVVRPRHRSWGLLGVAGLLAFLVVCGRDRVALLPSEPRR